MAPLANLSQEKKIDIMARSFWRLQEFLYEFRDRIRSVDAWSTINEDYRFVERMNKKEEDARLRG